MKQSTVAVRGEKISVAPDAGMRKQAPRSSAKQVNVANVPPDYEVLMQNGTWKPVMKLQKGDRIRSIRKVPVVLESAPNKPEKKVAKVVPCGDQKVHAAKSAVPGWAACQLQEQRQQNHLDLLEKVEPPKMKVTPKIRRDKSYNVRIVLNADGSVEMGFCSVARNLSNGGVMWGHASIKDEEQIRQIQSRLGKMRLLADRKQTILRSIDAQGKLTEKLAKQIQSATTTKRLEDL